MLGTKVMKGADCVTDHKDRIHIEEEVYENWDKTTYVDKLHNEVHNKLGVKIGESMPEVESKTSISECWEALRRAAFDVD